MTQPAPHYQPYQPMPYTAPPKPSGGGLTSMLAGILALAAAAVAVGGPFLPVTTYKNSFEADGDTTVYGTTDGWWGWQDNGSTSPLDGENSLLGLGLVLVAVLLVLGAVFAFVAARTRTSGPTTGGRSLITAGVGVLGGVMLVQALWVLERSSSYNDQELQAGESLDFSAGLGLVLPLVGLGLGLVAVVLAHVGQRQRAFRQEPTTPRMGFPAPYGYQQVQGAPGVPMTGVGMVAPAVAPLGAPVATAPPLEEDNSGETTQVVSNATATGADSASEAPAAAEPAPVAPPAPVTPPAPVAPVAPVPPAEPAAPESPTDVTPEVEPPAPTAAPESVATPEPSQSDLPAAPPAPELSDPDKK